MPVFRRLTLSLRQQKVRLLCLFFLLLSLSLLSGGECRRPCFYDAEARLSRASFVGYLGSAPYLCPEHA